MKPRIATLAAALAVAQTLNAGLVDWTFSGSYVNPMAAVAKPGTGSSNGTYESSFLEGANLNVTAQGTANFNSGGLALTGNGANAPGNLNGGNSFLIFEVNPKNSLTSLGQMNLTYKASSTQTPGSVTWKFLVADSGTTQTLGSFTSTIGSAQQLTGSPVTYSTSEFNAGTIASGKSLYISAQFSGFNGNNVALTFDDISISAVPEPTNIALGVFGVGFVSVAAGRRLLKRKSASL